MDISEIAIIGYGRFGKILAKLLQKKFSILVFDPNIKMENTGTLKFVDLEAAAKARTLFIAVPISTFSDLIQKIAPLLSTESTVIDVCSVKVHPVKIMQEFLPKAVDIIATHPMFGPDSIHNDLNLKLVMHSVRDHKRQYAFWKNYFESLNIQIIEMSPEKHDEAAAFSQGLTHFLGRTLEAMDLHPTPIDTNGFKKLLSIKESTCHDSWQLFRDLQNYNPYSEKMQNKFQESLKLINEKLK